jgi:hypothetical protein
MLFQEEAAKTPPWMLSPMLSGNAKTHQTKSGKVFMGEI